MSQTNALFKILKKYLMPKLRNCVIDPNHMIHLYEILKFLKFIIKITLNASLIVSSVLTG